MPVFFVGPPPRHRSITEKIILTEIDIIRITIPHWIGQRWNRTTRPRKLRIERMNRSWAGRTMLLEIHVECSNYSKASIVTMLVAVVVEDVQMALISSFVNREAMVDYSTTVMEYLFVHCLIVMNLRSHFACFDWKSYVKRWSVVFVLPSEEREKKLALKALTSILSFVTCW